MKLKIKQFGSWLVIAVTLAVTGGFLFTGSRSDQLRAAETIEKQYYTCGMDPQVVQDHPGKCPICGMKLRPMEKPLNDKTASAITIDPVTVQNMGFRSEVVGRGPLARTIRTFGTIDFDETHLTDVTARFRGWIEKLYVDSNGQQVRSGDPLFEIYSPELFAAENDYLQSLNQSSNQPPVNQTATMGGMSGGTPKSRAATRLKLFDLSDEQIAKIERSHEVRKNLTIASPAEGFVIEKQVVQGQMVEAGMKLYRIADLGIVWVQAQVYEQDLPFVKLGQEADVSLSYLADRKFRGRVAYIYPTVDEKNRTVKVRLEFHNPGFLLKPGSFATVEMRAESEPDALLVPESAVLRSGQKNTVFISLGEGKFEPRTITLGSRGENDMFQVLSGLNVGERVVTSGQFMMDSESQLREALQHMMDPNATNSPEATMATSMNASEPATMAGMTNSSPVRAALTNTNTVYICPMPEHVAIRYDHPGKCPLCSLTLVPVSETTYNKIAEENWHKDHPASPPQ